MSDHITRAQADQGSRTVLYLANDHAAAQIQAFALLLAQFRDRDTKAIAAKLLLVAAVFQISDGIQVVVLGALRGLQDVKIPMYITFVAYWIVGFPVSFYLGNYTSLKAVGVWIGLFAGLTAAAVFLFMRFHYLTKKMIIDK